jgi:hypothetical protein
LHSLLATLAVLDILSNVCACHGQYESVGRVEKQVDERPGVKERVTVRSDKPPTMSYGEVESRLT